MGIKSLGNKKGISYAAVWDETGTGAMKPYQPDLPLSWCGNRGLWGGGYSTTNIIDYITITTPGTNATDFGDLTQSRWAVASLSSGSRGCWAGGIYTSGGTDTYQNIIDYITIANTGNATDFGDLSAVRSTAAGVSNGTRGVWGGGYNSGYLNIIEYITIANTGNTTDFGDLTVGRNALAGCSAANDRGFYPGGHSAAAPTDIIDYITITTTGNATDFGDLTIDIYYCAAVASYSRALVGGGYPDNNTIGYFETSTPGNAIDFGDLTVARQGPGACSNGVGYDADRACWGGGGSTYDTIDYVAISTPGNATDFGDLTQARRYTAACSGD